MFKGKNYLSLLVLLLLALFLSACGGTTPAPPAPTVAPTTAAAPVSSPTTQPTAVPTVHAENTATPVDTAKNNLAPTDTPAAEANGGEPTSTTEIADAGGEPTATAEGAVAEGEPSPTAEAAGTPATAQGAMVADLGFRPEVNGFSFENYGGDTGRTNLEAADVQRMFGDVACASMAGGNCILTPAAEQWMKQINDSMSGGHCEGFAALSLAFYSDKEKADTFGAPNAEGLKIDNNQPLQREIAYYFATQYTKPTTANEIKKTPSEILDLLIDAFKNGPSKETYTMGIYQRGFKGGHAITPFAVQDMGGGKFAVLVYDNNYPNITRNVIIDRNANTWNYVASINPNEPASEYEGDATTGTLSITATTPRTEKQECAFCAQAAGSAPGANLLAPTDQQYNQIWLDGDGKMLLTDKDGHRLGIVDGNLVNEIPGAYVETPRSGDLWKDSEPPTLFVPTGIEFTVTLDGTGLADVSHSSVTMIGPGYDLAVDDIALDPGQKDSIVFPADGKTVMYKTDYNESPTILLGIEGKTADYEFEAKGVDIESGGTMTLGIDTDKGRLSIATTGNKEVGAYSLIMNRIDDAGEQAFGHDNIELDPNSTAYLDYTDWKGDGSELSLTVDTGNDGTIDDTIALSDQ